MTTIRGRGRPRREEAGETILDAARTLIRERGYRGFTVDDVTARTGIVKTTIYRRWPSKASLAAAAFAGACSDAIARLTTKTPDAIIANLEELLASDFGAIAAAVIAESQSDLSLRETVRSFTEPHRDLLAQALSPAEADQRIGEIWFRLLVPLIDARS
ncbi:MAG: helix-turn-helix transcriptional regulator [Thermoanaerobaculia bacterium]|nr:helix-turn-helix transcriptional regulator [Thermoanaerobaculia bacterium]